MATRDFKLLSIFSKPLAIPLMLFVLIVLIAFVLYFQLSLVQKLDLVSGLELKLKNISACDSVELQIDGTSKNVVASECVSAHGAGMTGSGRVYRNGKPERSYLLEIESAS